MQQFIQFFTNHLVLGSIFVGLLLLILINELLGQKKKAKELTPQAAIEKINHEDAIVIDLRDKEAFNKAHIIHSIQVNPDELDETKMNKYKDKPLILVCAKGLQSSATAAKLQSLGFQSLVLGGGLAAWQSAGLPLVKGKN